MKQPNPFILSTMIVVVFLSSMFWILNRPEVKNADGFLIFTVYFFLAFAWSMGLGCVLYLAYCKKNEVNVNEIFK